MHPDLRPKWKKRLSAIAVFALAFLVFGGGVTSIAWQAQKLQELQRIRQGVKAPAEILQVRFDPHPGSKGSVSFSIYPQFKFTYQTTAYFGDKFAVFDQRFSSARDAAALVAVATSGAAGTAHFEPSQPSRAVLDTTLRIGAISSMTFGGLFGAFGLFLPYFCHSRDDVHGDSLPMNTKLTQTGAVVLPPQNKVRIASAWIAFLIAGIGCVAVQVGRSTMAIEPYMAWLIAGAPLAFILSVFGITVLLTRHDAGAIVLDDARLKLQVLPTFRFSKVPRASFDYHDLIDVHPASQRSVGTTGVLEEAMYFPVLTMDSVMQQEHTHRVKSITLNRARCERLCSWLRQRLQIEKADFDATTER